MLRLISYDVNTSDAEGKKRLRRIAKLCQNSGQRVQFSVFECKLDLSQWVVLKNQLLSEMDEEKDSLRFYYLGSNWKGKIEHFGARPAYDVDGPLIV